MEVPAGGMPRETLQSLVEQIRRSFREELKEVGLAPTGTIELAPRWDGGTLILRPSREGLAEKEIPVETFFHKIVMARERLRVLEQKINNHPKLNDTDKIELQEYITRIYGSFTTFNLLFEDRAEGFTGSGER